MIIQMFYFISCQFGVVILFTEFVHFIKVVKFNVIILFIKCFYYPFDIFKIYSNSILLFPIFITILDLSFPGFANLIKFIKEQTFDCVNLLYYSITLISLISAFIIFFLLPLWVFCFSFIRLLRYLLLL